MARVLARGWWLHLKMLARSAFDGVLGVVWPLFFATTAFLMYGVRGDEQTLLYAAVGASVMGVWSSVSTSASMAVNADTGPHRLLVATDAGAVLGWASSGRLRPRPAYDRSVETSVYLDPSATGRGVGTLLYGSLLAELAREDLHRAFALVALPNDSSDALHRRLGFREAGIWSEAGRKLGCWWDVRWYERPLPRRRPQRAGGQSSPASRRRASRSASGIDSPSRPPTPTISGGSLGSTTAPDSRDRRLVGAEST